MIEKLVKKRDRVTAPPPVRQEPKAKPAKTKNQESVPQALEIEKAVLAVMLQYPDSILNLSRLINQFYFFSDPHRIIYQTICDLNESGNAAVIQLTERLRENKKLDQVGGPALLMDLQTMTVVPETLDWYVGMLRDKFSRREMIRVGSNMIRAAHGEANEISELVSSFSFSVDRIREDLRNHQNGTQHFDFDALMAFDSKHDPNCLVGNRYLVRGGSSLWAGGSGYGKSSLALQLAVYWACGVPCFGLRPVRPLKSLFIQAENDEGDMGEQLQGVKAGILNIGNLNFDTDLIKERIDIYRVIGKTGYRFIQEADSLIQVHKPDIVWPDPFFAFAGCDLLNAEKTGHFLREQLFPLAVKRQVAINVMHHVGKPVRDSDDRQIADIDYQYLGFGTSEIQNAFRAVNVLVPVKKEPGLFKLVFAKRGERAAATDSQGDLARSVYLQHSKTGIYWCPAEKPEDSSPAKLKYTEDHVLEEMSVANEISVSELQRHLSKEIGMSRATFYRLWDGLKRNQKVATTGAGKWVKSHQSQIGLK